jgi:hypothetical protein
VKLNGTPRVEISVEKEHHAVCLVPVEAGSILEERWGWVGLQQLCRKL